MKTKIILFAFLTFVFTAIGQITPDIISGSYNHASALSPNGEYVVVAADGHTDFNGLLKVYKRNTDNTFSLWDKDNDGTGDEYIILKGAGASAGVAIYSGGITISNTGQWSLFYQNSHINTIPHYVLMTDGIEIDSFTQSMGANSMEIIDGALYMSGQANSGIPYFKKYSMANNLLEWSINPGGNTPRIIKTEGFDPHLKMWNGDLIKFDDATGANLGVVASGHVSDVYQINDGEIEHYYGNGNPLQKLVFSDAEMDWGESNLWASGDVDSWKRTPSKTFLLGGGILTIMSDKLVHGFRANPLIPGNIGIDLVLDSHIFDDGSVTLITYIEGGGSIEDTIDIRHSDYAGDVVVPTLNISGTNVQSVFDGQRYNGTDWINVYERVGTVVLNGTMPNVGDFADTSLVNVPSGYILVPPGPGTTSDISPVEIDSDGNLFVRFVFYENGAPSNLNNLRVYLKSSSALGVGENNLDVISGYFNKSNQSFIIRSQEQITQGVVYDINGRKIILFSDNNDIYVGNLSTGVYIVKAITDTGKLFNKKFIKH